jgi:DNA-directed RNA polymerase subunit M/transcription elongation factor TFIIS
MEELKNQDVRSMTDSKQEAKHFDYGHLVMFCGKCGSKYVLEENVSGDQARQIVLAPTSTSGIRLVCKDCSNEMSLFFIESNKKKENEVTDQKSIQEEGDTNESVPEDGTITAELI